MTPEAESAALCAAIDAAAAERRGKIAVPRASARSAPTKVTR